MRVSASFAAWVLALGLTLPAAAQSADRAAADALFREGRAAAEAGQHEKACAKFRESNRLDPAPGTVLNIADCEEKMGRLATAWALYSEVTERLPASDDRHTVAKERAAALAKRVPKLSVRLAEGAPEGARVVRDGTALGTAALDTALPVDPGAHVIVVEAPGHERSSTRISIAEGEQKSVTVSVGAAKPGSTHGAAPKGSSSKQTWGWVLGGVGVVGVGIGAVTGVMVLGKKSTVDDNCDADKRCNQTGLDAAESGRTLGTVSGASFIVGGVALAAGAYLLLTTDSEKRPETALRVGPRHVGLVRYF